MGYMHIDNLYANQDILMLRECYALEKVHGTSANVGWKDGRVRFFSGGAKHDTFVAIFDEPALAAVFTEIGHEHVTVHGEAYGGKEQGMRATYGDTLRFVAFEVNIGGMWLSVPQAEAVVAKLGLEFVPYRRVSTDLEVLNAERDRPSEMAERRGMGTDKPREGVVLRPLIELAKNNGARIMAKHKGDAFRETAKPRPVVDPARMEVLTEADAIASEWVTPTRLQHVLDALLADSSNSGFAVTIKATPVVIQAMQADVKREAAAEIVWSKEAERAIGKLAAHLFKQHLVSALTDATDQESVNG